MVLVIALSSPSECETNLLGANEPLFVVHFECSMGVEN